MKQCKITSLKVKYTQCIKFVNKFAEKKKKNHRTGHRIKLCDPLIGKALLKKSKLLLRS